LEIAISVFNELGVGQDVIEELGKYYESVRSQVVMA
jgi:hypothetical protein